MVSNGSPVRREAGRLGLVCLLDPASPPHHGVACHPFARWSASVCCIVWRTLEGDANAVWKIVDGNIVGTGNGKDKPQNVNSLLTERRDFRDFHLRAELKLDQGNSGLFYNPDRLFAPGLRSRIGTGVSGWAVLPSRLADGLRRQGASPGAGSEDAAQSGCRGMAGGSLRCRSACCRSVTAA